MPERHLKFHFDYVSPNAYLAWNYFRLRSRQPRLCIEPVPVLFAGLLDAHGQRGPAEIPAKMRWMNRNLVRKARAAGVPLNPPFSHPFNPLTALRLSLLPELQQSLNSVVEALFRAVWVRRLDAGDPAILHRLMEELDLDATRLLEQARSPEIKELLRQTTARAVDQGVFGVPTMVVDDELFWGYDDIANLELYLDGHDPLTQQDVKAWSSVLPSAGRKADR